MRLDKVVREVRGWIERFDYIGNFNVGNEVGGDRYVEFTARTTKTRASSIVTRVRLIVQDVVSDRPFQVLKRLEGSSPATRDDLATWHIVVRFSSLRGLDKRAA